MPPVIPAVIAAAGAAIAGGSAITVAVTFATTLALGFISQALAPKPRPLTAGSFTRARDIGRDRGRSIMVRGSAEPHRIIHGTTVVSGVLVAAGSSGADNQFLHLVIALAGHQVEAINTVFLNDTASTDARFSGLVRINRNLGREDQAADPDLLAEFTGWSSSHRLRGIAYLYVRLKWDANVWVNGIPNVKAEVQGRRVWDPRTTPATVSSSSVANPTTIATAIAHGLVAGDRVYISGHTGSSPKIDGEHLVLSAPTSTTFTIGVNVTTGGTGGSAYKTAFSNNAALCQLDYVVASHGVGADSSEIDTASWIAAANVCDENVVLLGGGTQKRYTCDGSFSVDRRPIDIMEALLSSSAGTMIYQQGTYRGHAGAFTTPTAWLTEDDLRGEIDLFTKPSRKDLFNAVRGTFVDADNFSQDADFAPVTSAAFEAEDGNIRLFRDIELPFTQNNRRAQRIAKIHLERARRPTVIRFPAKLTALEMAAWDTVHVRIERLGWSNKTFRILEWALAENGGVDLVLQEEDASVYAWSAEEQLLTAPPATVVPDPTVVPTPTQPEFRAVADGFEVSWTSPADQLVTSGGNVEIQFKRSSDTLWLSGITAPGDQTMALIAGVNTAIQHDIRVRFVNQAGVVGTFKNAALAVLGTDSLQTVLSEASRLLVSLERLDSIGIGITDRGLLKALLEALDSMSVELSDRGELFASLESAESTAIGLSEVSDLFIQTP